MEENRLLPGFAFGRVSLVKLEHIIALFLLLGLPLSGLYGWWVAGAPSPAVCILWFYGGCFVLLMLLLLLSFLYELAVSLVSPAAGGAEQAVGREGGRMVVEGISMAKGVGLLCKYLGAEEALGWYVKGALGLGIGLLLAFLGMLGLAFIRRRCR